MCPFCEIILLSVGGYWRCTTHAWQHLCVLRSAIHSHVCCFVVDMYSFDTNAQHTNATAERRLEDVCLLNADIHMYMRFETSHRDSERELRNVKLNMWVECRLKWRQMVLACVSVCGSAYVSVTVLVYAYVEEERMRHDTIERSTNVCLIFMSKKLLKWVDDTIFRWFLYNLFSLVVIFCWIGRIAFDCKRFSHSFVHIHICNVRVRSRNRVICFRFIHFCLSLSEVCDSSIRISSWKSWK